MTSELGEALIVADGNFARGHRLSRRDLRHLVDGYLRAANVSRPGCLTMPCATPSATLAYRYTRELRAVQDMLGHQDPIDDRPLRQRRRPRRDKSGA